MAEVGFIEGEKLLIKVGNGASPEVFTHPALINTTRGVTWSANISEAEIPDAATPANPATMRRRVKSVDFTLQGAGKCDKTSVLAYVQWLNSGVAKNIQIVQNDTGANGGFTRTGSAILKDFSLTGARGDFQEITLSIVPNGPFVVTGNP